MNHSLVKKSCAYLALIAGVVLTLTAFVHPTVFVLNASNANRTFTLKAAQNQAAAPAAGIGTDADIHPNTTVEGAALGAYVNTKIWHFDGTFTYGDESSGIWASYEGTNASAYIVLFLEIHNPLIVSGKFCLSEGINYAPAIDFYPGTISNRGSSLGNYSLGDNLSTNLQSYTIDVASKNFSQTPNVIAVMVQLNHTNGHDVRITLDQMSVTYAC
jgi:hypothetical protein